MAVARIFYYLAPLSQRPKAVSPLLRLLHTSRQIERVVVENLAVIAIESPVSPVLSSCFPLLTPLQALLAKHHATFYIRADDLTQVKQAKLRILVALLSADNYTTFLREFEVSRSIYSARTLPLLTLFAELRR